MPAVEDKRDPVDVAWDEYWAPKLFEGNPDIPFLEFVKLIKAELYDYKTFFLDPIPKLYDEITGGLASKAETDPDYIIERVNERLEAAYQDGYADGETARDYDL